MNPMSLKLTTHLLSYYYERMKYWFELQLVEERIVKREM